jgi:hypothetical protein
MWRWCVRAADEVKNARSVIRQAAFGEAVLKRLQEDGVEIAGVSAPRPAEGQRPDALWAAAEAAGLPAVDTAALKQPDGLAAWKALNADLCAMAFVTAILSEDVFAASRLGAIQYHPSILPAHRGSSAMNWAIINGDSETGLTIFWPDRGIDTGPILLQKRCPIGPDDTVGSLYFDKLFPGRRRHRRIGAGRRSGQPASHARPRAHTTSPLPTSAPPPLARAGHAHHALIRGATPARRVHHSPKAPPHLRLPTHWPAGARHARSFAMMTRLRHTAQRRRLASSASSLPARKSPPAMWRAAGFQRLPLR